MSIIRLRIQINSAEKKNIIKVLHGNGLAKMSICQQPKRFCLVVRLQCEYVKILSVEKQVRITTEIDSINTKHAYALFMMHFFRLHIRTYALSYCIKWRVHCTQTIKIQMLKCGQQRLWHTQISIITIYKNI